MEVSSNETIKQAVMADMGISFISSHTVGLELAAGKLVILDVVGLPIVATGMLFICATSAWRRSPPRSARSCWSMGHESSRKRRDFTAGGPRVMREVAGGMKSAFLASIALCAA